jgi:hypothetical protein
MPAQCQVVPCSGLKLGESRSAHTMRTVRRRTDPCGNGERASREAVGAVGPCPEAHAFACHVRVEAWQRQRSCTAPVIAARPGPRPRLVVDWHMREVEISGCAQVVWDPNSPGRQMPEQKL